MKQKYENSKFLFNLFIFALVDIGYFICNIQTNVLTLSNAQISLSIIPIQTFQIHTNKHQQMDIDVDTKHMKFDFGQFSTTFFQQSNHSLERPDITYQIYAPKQNDSPRQQLGCETLSPINNTINEQFGMIVTRGTCTFGLFFHIYLYLFIF
jgi:hypothetical protein